ncbi:DUF805 domain-containing protein [Hyphococcus flavus]|uniref:DUF805 domain-containing protein n=1 Tax=Hyphococcus flavus TaxID=1866326 RepID=A0AAE9ZGW6_9PROT|nr:DUF805 domain-containing protein [Hyphococcus flavus]WDI30621.1 DUF805 domain-containing protein [Hyphococcus flavus]
MDIMQSVKTVLGNYANFNGRSSRAEFWWWALAYFVAYVGIYFVGGVVGVGEMLAGLLALGLLVPNIAVSVRRFHDIGKSGWWCLIFIIPLVGLIAMIFFFTKPSEGPNQFGEGPMAPVA